MNNGQGLKRPSAEAMAAVMTKGELAISSFDTGTGTLKESGDFVHRGFDSGIEFVAEVSPQSGSCDDGSEQGLRA